MIGNLLASAINNMRDLVCNDEFQILYKSLRLGAFKTSSRKDKTYLCSEFISNEKSILNLDRPDHVIVHHLLLLLVLHHLMRRWGVLLLMMLRESLVSMMVEGVLLLLLLIHY